MKYTLILLISLFIIAGCTSQVQEKTVVKSIPKQADPISSITCQDNNCFSNNLRECKPASFVAKLFDGFSTKNEILGIKDSGCEYKYTILESPDSSTVGKWMTCIIKDYQNYGSSNLFTAPSAETCSGPLVE